MSTEKLYALNIIQSLKSKISGNSQIPDVVKNDIIKQLDLKITHFKSHSDTSASRTIQILKTKPIPENKVTPKSIRPSSAFRYVKNRT